MDDFTLMGMPWQAVTGAGGAGSLVFSGLTGGPAQFLYRFDMTAKDVSVVKL